MELGNKSRTIKISQKNYTKCTLNKYGMAMCKSIATLIVSTREVAQPGREHLVNSFPYRQAVGALMYLIE